MTDRAYTVRELDELRRCVEMKYLFGSYQGPRGNSCMSRCYTETEKAETVEQQVRTHMLAGHTAADLIAAEQALFASIMAPSGEVSGS